MLGLKVAAPLYGIYEVLARVLQKLDSLCVCYSAKVVGDELLKSCAESLFKMSVEECDLVGALVKECADNVLEHILSYLDNIVKLCKSYLGLNVPELGKVLGSVGVLCTE